MIAYLTGKPLIQVDELVIVCNGVGYGVKVTGKTLAEISSSTEVSLYIYTHVKEDSLDLYGFKSLNDKALFKLLISVSGIGPATGLSILEYSSNSVITAIQNADISFFTGVKRVGKKAAQKIIIELKSKLGGIKDINLTPLDQKQSDLHEALSNLGFSETQINELVRSEEFDELSIEESIKHAIRKLTNSTQS
jgi:holliday junction DNA helicase RuvA